MVQLSTILPAAQRRKNPANAARAAIGAQDSVSTL
jgi:hypothetical protein